MNRGRCQAVVAASFKELQPNADHEEAIDKGHSMVEDDPLPDRSKRREGSSSHTAEIDVDSWVPPPILINDLEDLRNDHIKLGKIYERYHLDKYSGCISEHDVALSPDALLAAMPANDALRDAGVLRKRARQLFNDGRCVRSFCESL